MTSALQRARDHLARVDAAAPGLVVGLHLVGSAVLDDYRAGSDLDVVVELARPPVAADLDALAAAHRADHGVEALYVLVGELAGPVDAASDGPWSIEGELLAGREPDAPADAGTVEWMALGPPRLWHTVRTGEIVSKTRAGELAAEHWPDLAAPLADVLAARRGEPAEFTTRHAVAAVTLGRRVVDGRSAA